MALLAPALVVAALAQAAPPRVLAVRMGAVEQRPAVQVMSTAPLAEVGVAREGADLVLSFAALAPPGMAVPVGPPLAAAAVAADGARVRLRLTVPPDVPYDVRREGTVLHVVFGAAPPPSAADVRALYGRLFPVAPLQGGEAGAADAVPRAAAEVDQPRDGLTLGSALLRPALDLLYIDGEGLLLADQLRNDDAYLEMRPRLDAEVPLGNGTLSGDYELRARAGAAVPEARHSTHLANLRLSYPLGQLLVGRLHHHYATGTLEATEVDPGREYFFRLARFRRHNLSAAAQVETAARLKLDFSAAVDDVDMEEGSSFFDYQRRVGQAGLVFEVSPTMDAVLGFVHERVPPSPERPVIESTANSVQLGLKGDLTALLTGRLSLAYKDQESPRAAAEGQRFRGYTAAAQLTKDFTPTTSLALAVLRDTQLSSFEANAFYIGSAVRAETTVGGPFELTLRGGAALYNNDYRLPAQELGVPRHDRIVNLSVGAGRPLGRWAFLRADYTHERRDSNLDRLDTRSWSFVAQLGLGWFGSRVQQP